MTVPICKECGEPVYEVIGKRPGRKGEAVVYRKRRGPTPEFCSARCRSAFNNRRRERGAVLYDLLMGRDRERSRWEVTNRVPRNHEVREAIKRLTRGWATADGGWERQTWADWNAALDNILGTPPGHPPRPKPPSPVLTTQTNTGSRPTTYPKRRQSRHSTPNFASLENGGGEQAGTLGGRDVIEFLLRPIEWAGYAVGLYAVGLFVVLPGVVIGKHRERPDVPKWHSHVAILIVGAVAWAVIVSDRIG